MKEATELFLLDTAADQVLLGHKKTGIGLGKIVGIGGHLEPGETPEQAAVRELLEETTVEVNEVDLVKVAEMTFLFPHEPNWSMLVHNYVVTKWVNEPAETLEIRPLWVKRHQIPVTEMWDDVRYWLAHALSGKYIEGRFVFGEENRVVDLQMTIGRWR